LIRRSRDSTRPAFFPCLLLSHRPDRIGDMMRRIRDSCSCHLTMSMDGSSHRWCMSCVRRLLLGTEIHAGHAAARQTRRHEDCNEDSRASAQDWPEKARSMFAMQTDQRPRPARHPVSTGLGHVKTLVARQSSHLVVDRRTSHRGRDLREGDDTVPPLKPLLAPCAMIAVAS